MYSTEDVAIALGTTAKAVDNLVSRHGRETVKAGSRGASRKIPVGTVELVALALLLKRDLGMPFRRGWAMGAELLRRDVHRVSVGTLGTLDYDVARLKSVVRQALADSVQDRSPVRRGRPPAIGTGSVAPSPRPRPSFRPPDSGG